MIKGLPRPFLWTQKKTMDEFLNEDIYCVALYEHFIHLKDYNLKVDVKVDAVKLFNEVYYQLTRIYYEKPTPEDYSRYIVDIRANLGWSYSADLVMTIIYTYLRSKNGAINPLTSTFVRYIEYANSHGPFWQPFLTLTINIGNWPMKAPYPEKPCPVPPELLAAMYIDWKTITQHYDLKVVKDILDLWENDEDKKEVAKMINNNFSISRFRRSPFDKSYAETREFLKEITGEDIMNLIESITDVNLSSEEISKISERVVKEKIALQNRVEELETEIENLKVLLSPENNHGKNRKFTLVEIVEYCKKKHDYEDVRGIVAMLYKLLQNGNKEESDMVESIDEEFNKKKYGYIFENAQVTMQQPTINGPINDIHGNKKVNLGEN